MSTPSTPATPPSKPAGKFSFDDIISSVKSLINPTPPIPKSAEGDPIGFRFSELGKLLKEIGDNNVAQANAISKANTLLGALYKDIEDAKKGGSGSSAPAAAPAAASAAAAPAATPAAEAPAAPAKEEEKK